MIGRRTMGIGTVQKKIELEDGTMLNISYAKMVGPSGTDFNGIGLGPDIEVPRTTDGRDSDKILQTALERAKEQQNPRESKAVA